MRTHHQAEYRVIALMTFIMLSGIGCTSLTTGNNSMDRMQSSIPLFTWVDRELAPYIAQKMGKHPKFKGEPFFIVAMKGDNIKSEIDDLTLQIRTRVLEVLKSSPGVEIVWRPSAKPWEHHRTLRDVNCSDMRKISYYIGLDIGMTPVNQQLTVKVGALNPGEEKWEENFFVSWKGKPSEKELDAMKRKKTDQYLTGLRPQPFREDQPDLFASYLARNLSCLLKERTIDQVVIYPESGTNHDIAFFSTAIPLVYNYLDKFNEIRITQDPEYANIIIKTQVHQISDTLYQFWVSAKDKEGIDTMRGTSTEAYVSIPQDYRTRQSSGQSSSIDEREIEADISEPAQDILPGNERDLNERDLMQKPLIESFKILTPLASALCSTNTPWLSGEKELTQGDAISSNACVALELITAKGGNIYFINQDSQEDLTLLFPNQCEDFKEFDNYISPGNSFRFPPFSDQGVQALDLLGIPGEERVYVVIINESGKNNPQIIKSFESRIRLLKGICDEDDSRFSSKGDYTKVSLEKYFKTMQQKYQGQFDWQVKTIRHVP
ncbi:hypothetical protein [Desulfobacula toluolica]|uniref:Conserved uncharacterized protein n=1 Tax=Desulfobacula toluolica (strain DSM 7467 / Tol2) TaxID=651182 RepID=K0NIC6_DESTT|nr:hypothetical protein [Desulfobacula toluolica]CCK80700.1 conserved uncharacterized protein [Desulfobacula toluolica Tol2]